MPLKEDKLARYLKLAIWFLAALALIVVAASGIKYTYNKRYIRKIAELEEVIKGMRATMNVESLRQFNIHRIIAIIDQYNRMMPTSLKYEIAQEIYDASLRFNNLDVDLICAYITRETNGTWNPEMVSGYGAMGLMQIMPTVGVYIAGMENLTWISPDEILLNPVYNIRIGARHLATLIDAYDVDGAIAAWHLGDRPAAIWIKSGRRSGILPKDTMNFIAELLRQYEQMKGFRM
ncbi:transglycosylase SLT domain-containing protein [candidate division KSB1 bacterium]|nr:transglycosylase SLT domain-containing protein [candidate division KSB1 bacterium]